MELDPRRDVTPFKASRRVLREERHPDERLYFDVHPRTVVGMTSMTVSEARAALPELLTRVEDGEEVTITRHGRAVAVLVRPDSLRSRAREALQAAGRIHELLAGAASTALPSPPGLTAERAEELIDEIRAGRDGR